METVFIPRFPAPCGDAAPVELQRYISVSIPIRHTGENLPDNLCSWLVNRIFFIHRFISIWQAVVYHAFFRIIPHSTGNVLCQILGVKLIDVHHVPQSESSGSIVLKILLDIQHSDSTVGEPHLIHHGLHHVPPNAV